MRPQAGSAARLPSVRETRSGAQSQIALWKSSNMISIACSTHNEIFKDGRGPIQGRLCMDDYIHDAAERKRPCGCQICAVSVMTGRLIFKSHKVTYASGRELKTPMRVPRMSLCSCAALKPRAAWPSGPSRSSWRSSSPAVSPACVRVLTDSY
jgi:hypothetical protein